MSSFRFQVIKKSLVILSCVFLFLYLIGLIAVTFTIGRFTFCDHLESLADKCITIKRELMLSFLTYGLAIYLYVFGIVAIIKERAIMLSAFIVIVFAYGVGTCFLPNPIYAISLFNLLLGTMTSLLAVLLFNEEGKHHSCRRV